MPKWGLSPIQRRTRPWNLDLALLEPAKVITDPVHGDIYLTQLEQQLVDSPPMQRLRRVRQLGTTHLVYPGATHSRFSHALGALRSAQDLFDAVLDQRYGAEPVRDVFQEWEADQKTFDKKVAEAMVLVRLGALLHDLCHVPFGHSVEDDLGILKPHDENAPRFEQLWRQLPKLFESDLTSQLRPLILSKEEAENASEQPPGARYPFAADIVGNTICADLLDYLPRDHLFTGLPAKLGHRFISGFYVTPRNHPYCSARMVMRITHDQRPRADVVSELFKFLRYRYELSERALVHHAKLSADAMVGKLLEMWRDSLWVEETAKTQPKLAQEYGSDTSKLRSEIARKQAGLDAEIDEAVRTHLEKHFLRHGDDGLLEYILQESGDTNDRRKIAIAALADDILNRRLFKQVARSTSALARAKEIHKDHGSPESRRQLEEDAARYAGLAEKWHAVLWIPAPSMRLKAAEVLVDDGSQIAALKDLKIGKERGKEIYDSHEALWGISVFAHPSLRSYSEKVQVILARLSEKLGGIAWDVQAGQPSMVRIAAQHVGRTRHFSRVQEQQLEVECGTHLPEKRKDAITFDALVKMVEDAANQLFPPQQALALSSTDENGGSSKA